MKFFFVIVLIQINYLISGFKHVERLNNQKEDNGSKRIKRINVKDGEFTNRIVFTTTREDDPLLWFNNKYQRYEYIGQFWIGKTKYIKAQIRQSKTKEALSTLREDQNVNVLRQNPEISWVTQEKAHTRRARTLDTKWPILWYLNGDVSPSIKIDKAWAAGYSGKGITIAVLDDGLQTDHPDLAANIDTDNDKDFYDYDDDPRHEGGNSHGTECSGLIGAIKDNNRCVVGVAFSCTLIGIRILGDSSLLDSDEAQALNHYISKIDIYSNSWGPGELTGFEEPGPITKAALQNGVTNGRNGKGSIYIWAAGNGGTADNCNADGYANSIHTVTITGVQIGTNAYYSEVCAPALAAAYGGSEEDRFMTTTTAASGCKTEGVQGTSYAAPIATGIAALTLEANPNLTWRDIQHLIVFTSNRNGFNDTYSEWSINGANKEFSQVLGFGLLDAEAMIKYGKHWVTVQTQQTCSSSTSYPALSTNTSASDSITITSGDCSSLKYLEHVLAHITFSYTGFRGVTQLYLVSPSGTRSHLLHYRNNDAVDNEPAGTLTWTFMSVHFWKENPIGSWSLEISSFMNDIITVSLDSWSLTLYGTSVDPWPKSANPCAENVDKFHTNWSKTAEDTLATLTCTGEYTGNVSRYCSSVGKWEVPNYSNCISKSIQYIKEQTAKLLSGAGNNVTIILIGLENITRNNNDLRSGDLLTSSSILTDIAKYVTDHKDKLSVDQLEIFASLCNNLLDERNRQPWEELIDGGSGGVTPLVNAVTEFNDAFNDVIESNFSLVAVKENVVMEVGRASSGEIIVPDRSKTNGTWISDSRTEIKLKLEKNKCSGLTGYSSTFYRNVSRLFPEYLLLNGKVKSFNGSYDVNSIIADFTIHGSSCSNYTLIIKFDHLLGDYIRPFCGHWDFNATNTSNGAWSSFGSQLVDAEDSYTICEYNHTTNFAILMSPVGRPLSRAHHLPLSLISTIGCGLSILFLVMTIIIHVVFWRDVSDDGTKVLMNLCVALIISYVLFLAGITQTENQVVCSVIAVAIHYLFLTDFALMLAEGILFVKMVVFIFNKRSIVNQLILPCWIVPAVIVGISAGVTKLEGYGNHKYCWLSPETNLIWAFIGPALLVITINVIVIIITVYKMMTVKAVATKTPKEKSKIGLKGIRVMLPLFGVTWVLGTFSLNDDLVMFQYLFAICNSLQGLFIFVFNCCLTDKIRKGYREYKRRRANQMDSKLSTECTNNDNLKTAHRRQNVYTEEMDNTL